MASYVPLVSIMQKLKTAVTGFATGAALMYFTDPDRGRRRRAITRDKVIAACHDVTNEIEKARRDALNRARGSCASRAVRAA